MFEPKFYLSKFEPVEDTNYSKRTASIPIDITMTNADVQAKIAEGYEKITAEDWNYYVGNMGAGDNGTGYVRDNTTKKPISAPPIVITKAQKASSLASEYQSKIKAIDNELVLAQAEGDTELIEELKQEKQAILAEYQQKLEELEAE